MTLDRLLNEFYRENKLPEKGGENKDYFKINAFGFTLLTGLINKFY